MMLFLQRSSCSVSKSKIFNSELPEIFSDLKTALNAKIQVVTDRRKKVIQYFHRNRVQNNILKPVHQVKISDAKVNEIHNKEVEPCLNVLVEEM